MTAESTPLEKSAAGPAPTADLTPPYKTMTQCTLPEENLRPRPMQQDPWLGKQLRDYVIESLVGAGGMGRVYKAKHQWLDMPVAVKIINEELAEDEAGVARFRREALAVARLNHPNIIRATDGGVEGNHFFLVTEFIHGENLSSLLKKWKQLTVADACAIICQAATALQHAHESGMVHRDVKPSNLMLTTTGQVKLLDLGLARFTNPGMTLTESGQVMGTLDFMAPEQAGDTRKVDIRADIYSLGCTLYCLLTGTPPFTGPEYDTAVSKMLAHAEADPPPVTQFRRNVPAGVLACLTKMMQKERDDRFRTPAEVVAALAPYTAKANLAALCDPAAAALPSGVLMPEPFTITLPPVFSSAKTITAGLVFVTWVILRTVLCIVGILQREALPSLRPNAPTRYAYSLSFKGLLNWLMLGGIAFFVFYVMGFEIHFEPPPGQGPGQMPGQRVPPPTQLFGPNF
jgi:serine/threonine protein kinase